ncbi:MAG: DUF533 domain-containing protein [Opitutaceae bacterium]|nr:DUF533 domain-containing protein [Opitutaceae bacterium]
MPIEKLFQNLSANPAAQGALGGAASGALVSLLLHPKARKNLGSAALKLGGAAALAGVGYYAYRKYKETKPAATGAVGQPPVVAPVPPVAPALPAAPAVSPTLAMTMIKAMIAATAADGTIDGTEMDKLLQALDTAQLTAAEKGELTAALNRPPAVEDIVAHVTGPEEAAEIYGAALEAINPDSPAEHLFLRRLARGLKLDDALVAAIHESARA